MHLSSWQILLGFLAIYVPMAAFNIQEALIWKEKIESVIDQHQEQASNGNKYLSFEYKSGVDNGRNASSSEHDSQYSAAEDEDDSHRGLLRRTTIGNGPPESVFDWTKEFDSDLANQNSNNQAFSRKYWRFLQCQNGLRIFEELDEVDLLPKSCSRAMKADGVVEATCEEIFELIMSMDTTRCEWDCSFQYGSLVEEVDGTYSYTLPQTSIRLVPSVMYPYHILFLIVLVFAFSALLFLSNAETGISVIILLNDTIFGPDHFLYFFHYVSLFLCI